MTAQHPNDMRVVAVVDAVDNDVVVAKVPIEERFRVESLTAVIIHLESEGIDEYSEIV